MNSRENYFVKLIKYIKNVYHIDSQIEYVTDNRVNPMYKTTTHFYNGMEQRVSKTADQIETKYFYSGTSLLFTADENNAKMSENIITLGGKTIASKSYTGNYADEFYFYNQDIRNSTTTIIGLDNNNDLELMKGYTYDIYGKATAVGNEDFINDITFTGAIAEGGDIYYMNARFYDANTQRFLSQDTYKGNAWEPMSQNLYTYVGNNPVNYVDPTGHWAQGNSSTSGVPSDVYNNHIGYFSNYLPYLYSCSSVVTTKNKNNTYPKKTYSDAEKLLIATFRAEAIRINQNKKDTEQMMNYIKEEYGLQGVDTKDGGVLNAFQHAFFAALNGMDVGTVIATLFANAHENKFGNDYYSSNYNNTVMDLHNNAIGLYLSTTSELEGMTLEEMAEYVFQIILEDGYWIKGDNPQTPDWAKME